MVSQPGHAAMARSPHETECSSYTCVFKPKSTICRVWRWGMRMRSGKDKTPWCRVKTPEDVEAGTLTLPISSAM